MAQVTDHDLPDPPKRFKTKDQKKASFFLTIRALIVFSAFYSFLHKAIVPVALSFFDVTIKEYSRVDVLFIPILFCAFFVFFYPKYSWGLKLFALSALLTAIFDLMSIWIFPPKGWLLISHLVCAVPGLISTLLLFTQKTNTDIKIDMKNLSAALAFSAMVCGYWLYDHYKGQEARAVMFSAQDQNLKHLERIKNMDNACGLSQGLFEIPQEPSNIASNKISIRDCGFFPLWTETSTGVVTIQNPKNFSVNLRVLGIRAEQKPVPILNKIIRPGEVLELHPYNAKNFKAYSLISDSHPELGVVFFGVTPGENSHLRFSRKPLIIKLSKEL